MTNRSFVPSPFGEKPSGIKKSVGYVVTDETLFDKSGSVSFPAIEAVFE